MPDIISHLASGYIVRNFRFKWETLQRSFPLVLFGLVLPDLLSRPYWIIGPGYFFTAHYFHTPFACFLQTLVLSCFFAPGHRNMAFRAITLGWVFHQSFDLFQRSLDPDYYYLFWPLLTRPFRIGLFWAGNWPYVAGATVLFAVITSQWFRRWIKNLKNALGNSDASF